MSETRQVYVHIRGAEPNLVARTERLDDYVNVDYDENGEIVGVEVMDAGDVEFDGELAAPAERTAAEELAEALETAAEQFARIQNIALPRSMIMARAIDGEDAIREALNTYNARQQQEGAAR